MMFLDTIMAEGNQGELPMAGASRRKPSEHRISVTKEASRFSIQQKPD